MPDPAGPDPVDADAALDRAERAVLRMEVALRRLDPDGRFPPAVAALLSAPLPPFTPGEPDPARAVRLAGLLDRLTVVRADVADRQRRVAGRLGAVRVAQRADALPILLDRLG